MKFVWLLSIFVLLVVSGFEKSIASRPPIDTSKSIKFQYQSSSWNQNSKKIDSAYLFFKDKKSNKIVKILLQETEPDSSQFSGFFSINWAKASDVSPEVYVSKENLDEKETSEFLSKIKSGEVKRQPIVFRKSVEGVQTLDVFDSKQEAEKAFKRFKRSDADAHAAKSRPEPIVNQSAVEVAANLEKKQMLKKMEKEAADRESERAKLERLEKKRQQEKLEKMKAMQAEQKRKQKLKAKKYANRALKYYKKGKFKKAEKLFRKSVDLDPENTSFYFYYAVTLYRNKKYNEALVILNVSTDKDKTKAEVDYYRGLIHLKLKELDAALAHFKDVKASNNVTLSSSAAFYEGVIYFNLEKYTESTAAFEFVLDNSKDPKLDDKAEEYIEKIANILRFKKEMGKKLILTTTFGATYDSNILFAPDSDEAQGTSLDGGGARVLLDSSLEYRVFYDRKSDFSAVADFLYMYSINNSEFGGADPMLININGPYSRKGLWEKKGYKLTFTPAAEFLFMDADNEGQRKNILQSAILDTGLTIIMSQKWFASYNLDIRYDDSLLASSVGNSVDNADALKYALGTDQSFFFNNTKTHALVTGAEFTLNDATGSDKKYHKLEIDVTWIRPAEKLKGSWSAGLSAYHIIYPDHSSDRKDTNFGVNFGFSKSINRKWSWATTAEYSNNQSEVSTNQYDRWAVLATATYKWSK